MFLLTHCWNSQRVYVFAFFFTNSKKSASHSSLTLGPMSLSWSRLEWINSVIFSRACLFLASSKSSFKYGCLGRDIAFFDDINKTLFHYSTTSSPIMPLILSLVSWSIWTGQASGQDTSTCWGALLMFLSIQSTRYLSSVIYLSILKSLNVISVSIIKTLLNSSMSSGWGSFSHNFFARAFALKILSNGSFWKSTILFAISCDSLLLSRHAFFCSGVGCSFSNLFGMRLSSLFFFSVFFSDLDIVKFLVKIKTILLLRTLGILFEDFQILVCKVTILIFLPLLYFE